MMHDFETREVDYAHGSAQLEGLFLTRPELQSCPTVLVCHGWEGRIDNLAEVGARLLPFGYQVFIVDLYGKGITGETPEQCEPLMQPFMEDRQLLADRLSVVVETVSAIPEVNANALAAIGFCFGGLCVLDLARIGSPLKGVASFHGVFAPTTAPTVNPITTKIAVYHGWDDPMAPPEDVVALGHELTAAGADWQILAFGQTMHAFMAKDANAPERGIQSNPRSALRAWTALERFLAECFS